ncbi:MAG: HU family DNA-binding protein [Clostridia bacterium]|nr:HU family DNA-binding protein [Clostridia bacterium]
MNKQEFIAAVAEATGASMAEVARVINASISQVTTALSKGDDVVFTGFGTFKAVKKAARTGINPATKAKINIPAKVSPVFKAGKALKDAVNK